MGGGKALGFFRQMSKIEIHGRIGVGKIIRSALNAGHLSRPTVPDDNQAGA